LASVRKLLCRSLCLYTLATASTAWSRPWNGITPGESTKEDVVKKFGDPSKVVKIDGKEVLGYYAPKAIRGTGQTQFRLDPDSGTVDRIDVFPEDPIDRKLVESSYGRECSKAKHTKSPCYVRSMTEDFKIYFRYGKLGLAVFFKGDGKTVETFVFTAPALKKTAGGSR